MATNEQTAREIVNQALNHPDAVETTISVATLLIGIEAELAAKKKYLDEHPRFTQWECSTCGHLNTRFHEGR